MAEDLDHIVANLRGLREGERARRLADGVRLFGWAPDADCEVCGDTGYWPRSEDPHMGCRAGQAVFRARCEDAERHKRALLEQAAALPERFASARLESHPHRDEARQVYRWARDEPETVGANLIVLGPVGTGKTGMVVGAMRAVWGWRSTPQRFWSVPDLLDRMRPGGAGLSAVERDQLQDTRILVLDDMGAEKPSDWTEERLFAIVNNRHQARRSTVATSNKDEAGLRAAVGDRTVSRLLDGGTTITLRGDDLRRRARA